MSWRVRVVADEAHIEANKKPTSHATVNKQHIEIHFGIFLIQQCNEGQGTHFEKKVLITSIYENCPTILYQVLTWVFM